MGRKKVTKFEIKCLNFAIHYLINNHTLESISFVNEIYNNLYLRLNDSEKLLLYNDITNEILYLLQKNNIYISNFSINDNFYPLDIICDFINKHNRYDIELFEIDVKNNKINYKFNNSKDIKLIIDDLLCWQKLAKIFKSQNKTFDYYDIDYNNHKYLINKFYF